MSFPLDISELEFRVEKWDAHGQYETLAACTNVLLAHGAFDVAAKEYPGAHLTLRLRARVIAEVGKR